MRAYRHLNFNSTMVRLKETDVLISTTRILFQFHYGTIKSAARKATRYEHQIFQFHYGTIKSLRFAVARDVLP